MCPNRRCLLRALVTFSSSLTASPKSSFQLRSGCSLLFLAAVTSCGDPAGPPGNRLSLRQSAITLAVGDSLVVGAFLERSNLVYASPPLTSVAWPADAALSWSTAATQIATLNGAGVLVAHDTGTTMLRVSTSGLQDSTKVRVVDHLSAHARFSEISTGFSVACALGPSGEAYCWGENSQGQGGYGSARRFTLTASPARVSGATAYTTISVGGYNVCALGVDGRPYCWGENRSGEVGDGTQEQKTRPTRIKSTLDFVQVSAGTQHACAIAKDGVPYCWGDNSAGQTGSAGGSQPEPRAVATLLRFDSLDAGGDFTCGLAGGEAYCWGSNAANAIGQHTSVTFSAVPVRVETAERFASISAGLFHVCALKATRELYCWGSNLVGQLGTGSTQGAAPTPMQVVGGPFKAVSAGYFHTCAIAQDDTAWCWGNNQVGANGNAEASPEQRVPVPVAGGFKFRRVVAGNRFSCGVTLAGLSHCWGENVSAKLGIGRYSESDSAFRIRRSPAPVALPF